MIGTALRRFTSRVLAGALLAGALAQTAGAQTVAFNPLVGANGDPYTGHAENGFTVTAITNDWHEGHLFGNPVPSIFGGPIFSPVQGTIEIRRTGGGAFTFQSVDLASNTANGSAFAFTGLLGVTQIFLQAGVVLTANTFETIAGLFPTDPIDLLVIDVAPGPNVTSFNVDNINLRAVPGTVPEPATVALFATGALVVAGVARRRSRR